MRCKDCGFVVIRPTCPKCGGELYQEKGTGAMESVTITPLHLDVLDILAKIGARDPQHAAPKWFIAQRLNSDQPRLSGNSVSGRLSELKGMDYADCRPDTEEKWDRNAGTKVRVLTWYWWITDKGMELLKEKVEAAK